MGRLRHRPAAAAFLLATALAGAGDLRGAQDRPAVGGAVSRAEALVEQGRPGEALEILEPLLRREPRNAAALLAASTARILLGDVEAGRKDLERALTLDPTLRQAWLNRAALDLADERLDAAREALERAEALDPAAADNDLNLGAVLLLQGDLGAATRRFERYLAASPPTGEAQSPEAGEAYYLVATNYALAGYTALALSHLSRAIELDDAVRLRARTDANFAPLGDDPRFQSLLTTDTYRAPPGSRVAVRQFEATYDGGRGRLLAAVLNALQLSGAPFDHRVEVTPEWALIRGELRIKVSDGPDGKGLVQLIAPPGHLSAADWEAKAEELFRQIAVHLIL
jgi:tetratricopeptide (TPR) repeat protein